MTGNTRQVPELSQSVWHHLGQQSVFQKQLPFTIERGEGTRIWDTQGNSYLDASSGGVWCVNVGYGRKSIAQAVAQQLTQLHFFSSTAGNLPATQFADRLLEKMPGMKHVYYASSGSEANEKAFKMVRQIAHRKHGGKKYKILYRERDYHGSTIATLSATGQEQRRNQYGPFLPGFVQFPHCCEYRNQFDPPHGESQRLENQSLEKQSCKSLNYGIKAALELEKVILREGPDTVGAVTLEPVTAGGGVITPPEGYWKTIQEICRKYDVLLHIDEVVCGLGRTGKWFGYQHYDIKPDIVTLAKGIASGYAAISCVVTTEEVYREFLADSSDTEIYFRDISTYAGCTAGPAAALENMNIIEEEGLLTNCASVGNYLKAMLTELQGKYSIIGDVRGKGLLLGVELISDSKSRQPVEESITIRVVQLCLDKGLIIGRTNRSFPTLNNTLCICPPLTLTYNEAEFIVDTLDEVLSALELSNLSDETATVK